MTDEAVPSRTIPRIEVVRDKDGTWSAPLASATLATCYLIWRLRDERTP